MKMFKKSLLVACCASLLSIASTTVVVANPIVMAGSDYFFTPADGLTRFDFSQLNSALGVIEFEGIANGPGGSDTQLRRLEDADLTTGSDTIDIELVALSLVSIDPVNPGGDKIIIELDTPNIGHSDGHSHNQGTMTISGGSGGGTFDSIFDVFVEISVEDVLGNVSVLASQVDLGNLIGTGGVWSSSPLTDSVIVEGNYGDLDANLHTSNVPLNGIDFFVEEPLEHKHAVFANSSHFPSPFPVPAPSGLVLLSLGLLPLVLRRKNKI